MSFVYGQLHLRSQLDHAFPLLVVHLVPPLAVLVELREVVHHDRDGKREDEDAGEGAEQKSPINFPKSVLVLRSYPTVVMVTRLTWRRRTRIYCLFSMSHLKDSIMVQV